MLVLSYALGLVPFDPSRVVALRGVDDVTFKRPAHIGDTIRVEGRVDSVEPLDDATGLVTCGWKVLNDRDETLARAKLKVLWRREAETQSRHKPDRRGREAEQAIGNEVFL